MNILVAYATKHGSTAGIAERIAATLCSEGLSATARPVGEVAEVDGYDAVIIGGAAYMFHWLRDATSFAKRHREALRRRPVWLFSSGPLGTERVDGEGRDVLETGRPKEFDELIDLLQTRGEQVFFGAWDPDAPPVGLGERMLRHLPAGKDALPAGDFRDWPTIEAWAKQIAVGLRASVDGGPPSSARDDTP
jgi:menaquinone-dependent protoporphyrinogen oxidase